MSRLSVHDYDQDWEDDLYDDYEDPSEHDGTYHFDDLDPSDYDDYDYDLELDEMEHEGYEWYDPPLLTRARCAFRRIIYSRPIVRLWRWRKCPSCGARGCRKVEREGRHECDACCIPF